MSEKNSPKKKTSLPGTAQRSGRLGTFITKSQTRAEALNLLMSYGLIDLVCGLWKQK